MATSTPPAAGKRPAGTVSTPSHPNYASPTAARHAAGKTPVNHPTSASTGSKTLAGSTPMVHNLSQSGMTSSPSANMFSFGTPHFADGPTPAGYNFPTPGLSGTAMMPSTSEMGRATGGTKRDEDEERRSKMRKVLRSIGHSKGRVSEEGLARIGRRVGFQNDIDAEKLTPEEMERKGGNRPISTAGNIIVVDLELTDNVPRSLKMTFEKGSKVLREQEAAIAKVLFDDLKAPNKLPLESTLGGYAMHLERLARIDRLSVKGINCFEALTGIYTCLCRLHDQEKLAAKALQPTEAADKDQMAEAEVLRKKSGKPLAHERGNIGLEILYRSQDKKLFGPSGPDYDGVYALRLDVESSPGGLFPSLRVSDSWLPDPLELGDVKFGGGIPWQDPPPSFLVHDLDTGDGVPKLPDIRFTAKLDPPLVLPHHTAMNIFTALGAAAPPSPPILYASLLLGDSIEVSLSQASAPSRKTARQTVLSQENNEETTVIHDYTFATDKADWGFELAELPFSHPRQLVELLPTLRQWASVSSLLRDVFVNGGVPESSSMIPERLAQSNGVNASGTTVSSEKVVPVKIDLATTPNPILCVDFPTSAESPMISVDIEILPNGDFAIPHHETEATNNTGLKMARALDVCGNLGVWIEWVRTQHRAVAD